jgi:hypothetical protein
MFLVTIARPRINGSDYCDGKMFIGAYTQEVAAKNSSKNRPRGLIEEKPYEVTADGFCKMMTKNGGLIASIKEKLFF